MRNAFIHSMQSSKLKHTRVYVGINNNKQLKTINDSKQFKICIF